MSVALLAAFVAQTATELKPIELRGRIRESMAASVLTVDENGLVIRCEAAPRPFDNVARPPDLCEAYRPGTRYGPPTTFKGKPQRQKVTVRITTYAENISR